METFIITYGKDRYKRFNSYPQSLRFYNFIKTRYDDVTLHIEKYSYLNKIIDRFLYEINLDRMDLDIKFKFNHHRYRIRSFSILWTVLTITYAFITAFGMYAFICLMIILFG